jgi:RNA polymerase sigma factor (sigma-70 family)
VCAHEPDDISDDELLTRSVLEPQLFASFYERQARSLLTFFARRTFDAEVAADLTAETFAQAFASRATYKDRGGGAVAWLYTIAHHELGHFIRRRSVEGRARARLGISALPLAPDDQEAIERLIDFEAAGRQLGAALGRLTAKEQEAIRLRVLEERPYREVANLLGCSEQVARARVSRGLRRLAREFNS